MLNNINAVIFDIDGTLLDSNNVWHQIDIDFVKQRNLKHPENLQDEVGGLSFYQVACYFKDKFNLDDTPEELVKIWHDMAYKAYREEIVLKEGAKDYLEYLHSINMPIAVCTSNSHELVEAALENNGVLDIIDLIVTADDIGKSKEEPDIYFEIARRLNVDTVNCLAFDDIYPALNAINMANMKSCAVYNEKSVEAYSESLLRDTADYFIYDFKDIEYERD